MYLEARTEAGANELHDLRRTLKLLQNQPISFGVARVIEIQQVVIVKTALRIGATPMHAADWSYQIARMYAESYNPRFGTGLIPDSAEAVEVVVDFWCRYYSGGPLDDWRARSTPSR